MYSRVNGVYSPLNILNEINDLYVEMEKDEQGFICSLIEQFKPSKVLEIGVATGATTAVIMNCLLIANPSAEMYSVDLCVECYRKKGKKTGYQFNEVENLLPNRKKHQFILGKELAYVIEEIGSDIDFVVLDTVHSLPGEILDFLCILPYLNDGAVVVLHDVSLNLYNGTNSYATKILFDAVSGDKYWNVGDDITNIAAFVVSAETRKKIMDVISSLSITWEYLPSFISLKKYMDEYKRNYDDDSFSLLKIIFSHQIEAYYYRKNGGLTTIEEEIKKRHMFSKMYIYGTERKGKMLYSYLFDRNYKVDGFVVSDSFQDVNSSAFKLSEIDRRNTLILLASGNYDCLWNLIEGEYDFLYISKREWALLEERGVQRS